MKAYDVLAGWPRRISSPMIDVPLHNERTNPLILVQVLRAFAALLVLIGHAQSEVSRAAAAEGQHVARLPFLPGGFGVDLFFCISGFIMVVSSVHLFATPHARKTFLLRRAMGLIPLYWLVTLCYAVLQMFGSHQYPGDLARALATSLAFIPFPTYGDAQGLVFPLYTLGWSLNYEVFFYLVFSLFIVLPVSRAIVAVGLTILVIVIAGGIGQPDTVALRFWSQPIILEFAFGVLIGYAWLHRLFISRTAVIALVGFALAFLIADPFGLAIKVDGLSTQNGFERVIGWGIPTAVALLAAVMFERHGEIDQKHFGFLASLGDCSYSLYLVHPFALLLITKTWKVINLDRLLGWEVLGVALIGGSVSLAIVSYRYFERPITHWLRQKNIDSH